MILGLALAALLVPIPQEEPPPADPRPAEILERRPDEWARSEPGAWAAWSPEQPVPPALTATWERATRAYAAGDLPAALDGLFEALAAVPEYPPALHQAGVIYFRLRRYSDSIAAFERYLAVAPGRVADTRALAHGYYTLGDYERARDHYARLIELAPDEVETHRGYGLCWMRLGEPEKALAELRRCLELDPEHANAAAWIAQILFDEERSEEALEAVLRARDLDPYVPRPWFLLSQVQFDLGRDEEAEASLERFRTLDRLDQEIRAAEARLLYDPRQPGVHARLVSLHRQAGDLLSVGRCLNRWQRLEPDRAAIAVAQLDLALELGEAEAAERLAENLRRLAGEELEAWVRLARYYAGRRDRIRQAEAEAEVARLRALEPR